ncbi:hypothetical protein [Streptomyces griseorubiginosus]|uniref:hypothetical protein n=1 Tax=Streptomyces griseorubiginosus TaxID=67304 RepID=UPI001AD74B3F|nr:hypothetical protein [Streptomyces griseorubiginosus]MBO4258018.1 hypothetical protein [Streptomyces griseorubiginosus]
MAAPDELPPLVEPYECTFDFQPGWVDLTLHQSTKAEARALAAEIVKRLNPLSLEIENSAVFDDLADRAIDLNANAPTLAAAYYSEAGEALANLRVDGYGDEGVPRPGADEVIPLILQWENAEVVGKPDIRHVELPTGPAVRVHAMLKVKRMFGFGRKMAEFIKYVVFPPEMQTLIVVTVEWEKVALTEYITELADEAVRTMRITPLASGGTTNTAGGGRG